MKDLMFVCAESVVLAAAMSTAAGCRCTFQDTQFLAGSCGATFTLFMGLVEYLVRSKDDIADACNRPGRNSIQVSAADTEATAVHRQETHSGTDTD
jgi:hypothetical protein